MNVSVKGQRGRPNTRVLHAVRELARETENLKGVNRNAQFAINVGLPLNGRFYASQLREAAQRVKTARNKLLRLLKK